MNAQHTRLAFSIDVEREEHAGLNPVIVIEYVVNDPTRSTASHHVRFGDGIAETPGGWPETMSQFEVL